MSRSNKTLNLDEIKVSCKNCSLSELCLPHGMSETEITELDKIVRHLPPMQSGQHLYRAGDRGRSLFAVRSGAAKSYCITESGDEQVLGFTLPGELVGLDGLSDGFYSSSSIVLETSSVCEMPYDGLEGLCKTLPGLNRQIMRVAAREISANQQMLMQLGKRTAEERLASFLLSLSSRFKQRGLSATEYNLPMSRQDIGNYLGLAIETVSRLFAHFQEQGLLHVNRKQITILDLLMLKAMVEGCVGWRPQAER
jgi:CRP/FNR family transcriptional regulator, anaerobic regulatory protein